ncbi:hypothetical protein DES45_106233 [Microvirga subterranea]|uniref:Uncharacterized protein n=1 Tax=Microvirga subterranea TaxID=186651 RepID=A0A370HN29_9HYPH|nr:hypothetical protein DES45_106233 [Microvirga subterranea]
MTASDQAAASVAEQGKAASDVRVSRRDQARSTALRDRCAMTHHARSNGLFLALYAHSLPIVHHRPAGADML